MSGRPCLGPEGIILVCLHRLEDSGVTHEIAKRDLAGGQHLLHVAFGRSVDSRVAIRDGSHPEMRKVQKPTCLKGLTSGVFLDRYELPAECRWACPADAARKSSSITASF